MSTIACRDIHICSCTLSAATPVPAMSGASSRMPLTHMCRRWQALVPVGLRVQVSILFLTFPYLNESDEMIVACHTTTTTTTTTRTTTSFLLSCVSVLSTGTLSFANVTFTQGVTCAALTPDYTGLLICDIQAVWFLNFNDQTVTNMAGML